MERRPEAPFPLKNGTPYKARFGYKLYARDLKYDIQKDIYANNASPDIFAISEEFELTWSNLESSAAFIVAGLTAANALLAL